MRLIRSGNKVLNVDSVTGCQWDKSKLFVYVDGGRFMEFAGDEAKAVWELLQSLAEPLVEALSE